MADNITIETKTFVTKKEEHTSTIRYGLNAVTPCLIMLLISLYRK